MSGRAIGDFFCVVIALIILSVPGQASELGKGHYRSPALPKSKPVTKPVLKPPSSRVPVISKKPVHKKIRQLPDLVVERVLLQKGKLIFTIKNRGQGPITAAAFRRGVVQIRCNASRQALYFVKRTGHHPAVDPNGLLQHPGGAVTYSTSFKPPVPPGTRAVVTVTVDSDHRISEQNERNNTGKTTYLIPVTGKIRADKRHSIASSPLPRTRSLQKKKHLPLTALTIERIYLKKNRIYIRIRNTTKRILASSDLISARLQLHADKKQRSWMLAKIDGKHALWRAGGSLDVDTSLVLDRQTLVTVRLETKGQVKTARASLTPVGGATFKSTSADALHKKNIRPASRLTNRFNKQDKKNGKRNARRAGVTELAATGLTLNSTMAESKRLHPHSPLSPSPNPGGAGDSGENQDEASAILDKIQMKSGRSIQVISPAQGDFVNQGSPVNILWQVNGDLGTDCMRITLRQLGNAALSVDIAPQYRDTLQGQSTHYQRGYTWTPPATLMLLGLPCRIRVETCNGTVHGDSGGFLITGMMPEYSVSNLHVSPSSPDKGETVYIDADFVNMGHNTNLETVSGALRITGPDGVVYTVGLDPQALGIGQLGFGGRYHYHVPYLPAKEGDYTVSLDIAPHPSGILVDPYPENNHAEFSFHVRPPLPDLVVCMSKYIFLKPPVSFGFLLVVKNIGLAPSGSNGEITLEVGGHNYERRGIPALQPGEKQNIAMINYTWWNHGVNHFTLTVDGLNRIEETVAGEQNNILRGLIDRNYYHSQDYDEFNATHQNFCSDDPAAATPVP